MTRREILDAYKVDDNGVIRTPGKFEGEMLYVPFYWEAGLEGCASIDTGSVYVFEVLDDERAMFPELEGAKAVILEESETGFVYCETRATVPDESEFDSNDESPEEN